MLRRVLFTALTVLMIPGFANAFNCWSIARSTAPTTVGAATYVVPSTDPAISINGNTINVTAATSAACAGAPTYVTFTVTAPAGSGLSNVKIDGVVKSVTPYTVNKGTQVNHSIVATYNTSQYLIDTTSAANGYISPDVQVASNATPTISVVPNAGYALYSVTIATNGGVPTTYTSGSTFDSVKNNKAYTFPAVTGAGSLTASFAPVASATAVIYGATQVTTPNTEISIDASGSTTFGFTPTYEWSVSPSAGTTFNGSGKSATFKSNATGSFTVTFKIKNDAVEMGQTTQSITVQSAATADVNTCSTCHVGQAVVTSYAASGHFAQSVSCSNCHNPSGTLNHHFNLTPETVNTTTFKSLTTAQYVGAAKGTDYCTVCHKSGGAAAAYPAVGDKHATVVANCAACHVSIHAAAAPTCASCHTAENTAYLTGKHSTHPYGEFGNDCAQCHTPHAPAQTVAVCAACHSPYPVTAHDMAGAQTDCKICHNVHTLAYVTGTITQTHIGGFAAALSGNPAGRAQYVHSLDTCASCHSSGTQAVLTEWAESGHADVLGEAWKHYKWKDVTRATCQRCHTTTGYVNLITGANDGIAANTFDAADTAQELVSCRACHTDVATGAIRAPGRFKFGNISTMSAGKSDICVRCHSGMDNMKAITNPAVAINFANSGLVSFHYLGAAGSVFNTNGYKFTGQTYTQGTHKFITNTLPEGPCLACHQNKGTAGKGHTFEVVTKTAGAITAINNQAKCDTCHNGMSAATLTTLKANVATAMEALRVAMVAQGMTITPDAYPYVAITSKDWTKGGTRAGADEMGAAANYMFVYKEPGAYAHNYQYTMTLIGDSIDFLTNGSIDRTRTNSARTFIANDAHIAAAGTACATCHNGSTNAPTVPITSGNDLHPTTGSYANCSACHGSNGAAPTATDIVATTDGTCGTCHSGRVSSFVTSVHYLGNTGKTCATTCHPAQVHGTPAAPTTPNCNACHGAELTEAFELNTSAPGPAGTKCQDCHGGGGHPHSIKTTAGNSASRADDCVLCHASAINHPDVSGSKGAKDFVKDNNGVRQITGAGGEFKQWSHHIINDASNAADPVNSQCVVCHLEGDIVNGVVKVDATKHMADAQIHLRNCNTSIQSTDAEYTWDPAAPNHTAMDQFCMSCHNADGATTAPRPTTALGAPKNADALNPFGDQIQNNYDGLFRNAVVAVYDQFDPSNTSHHAVRAARYTATTKSAANGAFDNISANNAAVGFRNLRYKNGTSYIGTMSDTGKWATAYKPLVNAESDGSYTNTFNGLADNSQIHCGDCHSVGQWAARGSAAFQAYSAAYGAGVTKFYKGAIGAHGSKNEYMLRNSKGTNTLETQNLVCFICHSESLYGNGASAAGNVTVGTGSATSNPNLSAAENLRLYNYTGARKGNGMLFNTGLVQVGVASDPTKDNWVGHDGVSLSLTSHCIADDANTAGLTGLARLNSASGGTGLKITNTTFLKYTSGAVGSTPGGGNALGNKCLNCHNSGDGTYPGYGGIHGNAFRTSDGPTGDTTVVRNAGYSAYSSSSNTTTYKTAEHKPYRFLPGLGNFRYNGSAGSYDWTMYQVKANNVTQSCYTLANSGSSTSTYPKNAPLSKTPLNNKAARFPNAKDDDNGLLGTWGSCTDHSGVANTYVPKRNVLRPTNY